jgi:hypothetical protein
MGCSPECEIAIDYEYDRFTHPLPRTVLTVSKCDVLTFEARPHQGTKPVASGQARGTFDFQAKLISTSLTVKLALLTDFW